MNWGSFLGIAKALIGYFCIAACAAAINICGFWMLYRLIGIPELVATVLSSFLGSCVNCVVGRLTLFKHQAHKGIGAWRDFAGVIGSSSVAYGLDLLFMWMMLDFMGIHSMLAKLISTALCFFWNFFVQRLVVYRRKK